MSPSFLATAADERPAYFQAGRETLFGIFTTPPAEPRGVAVVVAQGSGCTSMDRHRMSVTLCRRLAGLGFHAMRFDYHGVGESTGTAKEFRTDQPFTQDLEGAIRWVRDQGISRFVLVGRCFGARTALALAPQIAGLEGVVMIRPPARDMMLAKGSKTPIVAKATTDHLVRRGLSANGIRALFDPPRRRTYFRRVLAKARRMLREQARSSSSSSPSWVSPGFAKSLSALVRQRTPMLMIYGNPDDEFDDLQTVLASSLGGVTAEEKSVIDTVRLMGEVEGLSWAQVHDEIVGLIVDWVSGRIDSPAQMHSSMPS